jgi:hypothetical protein
MYLDENGNEITIYLDENGNEIQSIPSESPSEMRARAKSEFASDWLAQKKLEAESIRDTPIGKAASAFFPRSVENEIIVRKLESELVVVDSSEYMITMVDLENAYSVRNKDSFYLPGLLVLFLFLYFLPSYISWKRSVSRKKIRMILFLNFFAGWTFIVWLVLGIWSLSDFELK